jgi:hypothetical protein
MGKGAIAWPDRVGKIAYAVPMLSNGGDVADPTPAHRYRRIATISNGRVGNGAGLGPTAWAKSSERRCPRAPHGRFCPPYEAVNFSAGTSGLPEVGSA